MANLQVLLEQALKEEEIYKKDELNNIVGNILQVKYALQKLRSLVTFQDQEYSAVNGFICHQTWTQFEEQFDEAIQIKPNNHTSSDPFKAEPEFNDKLATKNDKLAINKPEDMENIKHHLYYDTLTNGSLDDWLNNHETNKLFPCTDTSTDHVVTSTSTTMSTKYGIVVGNTSQYLHMASNDDQITHKWMVYVRSLNDEVPLEHFTKCIIFFLHSTYAPNDIVTVTKPPFQLTKLGWGEFPVRVQLHFYDSFNKPVDIFHSLKLDQTRSGEQMLGAETHVNIELDHRQNENLNLLTTLSQTAFSLPPFSQSIMPQLPPYSNDSNIPQSSSLSSTSSINPPSPVLFKSSHSMSPPSSPVLHFSHPNELLFTHDLSPHKDNTYFSHFPPSSPIYTSTHYVTIPIKTTTDAIMLDHDYHTQTIVKTKDNASAIIKSLQLPSKMIFNDSILHITVRQLPLYGCSQSFSAQSLAQYNQWSVFKQRANEWMRAIAVKQCLKQSEQFDWLPSTRQIVSWCRSNGYTPLKSKKKFCKVCGCSLSLECHDYCMTPDVLTTVTHYSHFIEQLSKHYYPHTTDTIIDITVDCLSKNNLAKTSNVIYRVPQFPELRWVNKTANEVGVVLYPITHDKMLLHVVDHMIFSACSQFLCQLLRKAVNLDSEGSSEERIIITLKIYHAIKSIPNFDFLTNNGLGFSV